MLFTSPPASFPPAKKIISLVPSISELLEFLGLHDEVVGITKFCVHPPEWQREKRRIGGTKNIHVEEIISLKPDLVIASREENVKEQVDAVALHSPVFLTDVITISDAFEMIENVGRLTGTHDRAKELVRQIKESFQLIQPSPGRASDSTSSIQTFSIPAIYLIWKDPYMSVGGDTFISHMMEAAGLPNVLARRNRYPEISVEEMKVSSAEVIMLSSEPYPFKDSHVTELSALLPDKKIILVDGEMFSWYGSRMLYAAEYFGVIRKSLQ